MDGGHVLANNIQPAAALQRVSSPYPPLQPTSPHTQQQADALPLEPLRNAPPGAGMPQHSERLSSQGQASSQDTHLQRVRRCSALSL